MDCAETRPLLIDLARGRLAPAVLEQAQRHLEECPTCRGTLEAEQALDELVRGAVPRLEAPSGLRRRLAELASDPAGASAGSPPRGGARTRWWPALAAAAAALVLALGGALAGRGLEARSHAADLLTEELVNDHLRVLASQRPAEIESGGAHQVKPWFEGRLDFAPVVPAPAVAGLELHGGAIGYVLDRRAAVAEYTLRRHRVTLLVARAGGLPWPSGPAAVAASRGFQVVGWRSGELGYALVSDVSAPDLAALAEAFRATTGP